MFLVSFDIKNPSGSTLKDCESLEKGYADLQQLHQKQCPKLEDIIVGKDFTIGSVNYCFFEDDDLARMWLMDQRMAAKK
jgi:hypothetical protein